MPFSATDPAASVVERVRALLDRVGLRSCSQPILVAVSGGADSLCLLDVMLTLYGENRDTLLIGHVDHCLRADSDEDAAHVRGVADGYGVPCETISVDVPALSRQAGIGIEEAARIGRYRALSRLAGRANIHAIATGHTRSDSIETVLLHLLRGAGQRGLGGIAPAEPLAPSLNDAGFVGPNRRPVRIVRPLLDVDRAETVAYCQARRIPWRDDPTNADSRFLRNRVRQHLLPVLRTYNPAIDVALGRLAQSVRDDESWLRALVDRRFRQMASERDGTIAFELDAWQRLYPAARRRFVREVADRLDIADPGFDAVERALAVASNDGPARAELPGGLTVERAEGQVVFRRATLPARGDQMVGGGTT